MTPRYTRPVITEDLGFPMVRVAESFSFIDSTGREWFVPEGFISDLASVPFGLRWLVPRSGRHRKAAIVHDCLHYLQRYGLIDISHHRADNIMLEAAEVDRVGLARRSLLRSGLFVGSWYPWRYGKICRHNLTPHELNYDQSIRD